MLPQCTKCRSTSKKKNPVSSSHSNLPPLPFFFRMHNPHCNRQYGKHTFLPFPFLPPPHLFKLCGGGKGGEEEVESAGGKFLLTKHLTSPRENLPKKTWVVFWGGGVVTLSRIFLSLSLFLENYLSKNVNEGTRMYSRKKGCCDGIAAFWRHFPYFYGKVVDVSSLLSLHSPLPPLPTQSSRFTWIAAVSNASLLFPAGIAFTSSLSLSLPPLLFIARERDAGSAGGKVVYYSY